MRATPTPPAADDITIEMFLSKGNIYSLIDKKAVNPVGP